MGSANCKLPPDQASPTFAHTSFERPVDLSHTGKERRGRIDLYRKGCFVLEAKQGGDRAKPQDANQLNLMTDTDAPKVQAGHGPRGSAKWDDTMLQARNQADRYARGVAKQDGWPPFLIIVDVGHVFEFLTDFSRMGHGYTQFPDGNRYRMKLDDLRDPALLTARVTREIVGYLPLTPANAMTPSPPVVLPRSYLQRPAHSRGRRDPPGL
jgi:hypothetical protein